MAREPDQRPPQPDREPFSTPPAEPIKESPDRVVPPHQPPPDNPPPDNPDNND